MITPLNGTKTHPLSAHALTCLRELDKLLDGAVRHTINPGVCNRLEREDLIEVFLARSPYATRRGEMIQWVRITLAGRDRLAGQLGSVVGG